MRWPSLVMGFAQGTPAEVVVEADGVDEDGAPVAAATWEGECSWQDASRRVIGPDRAEVEATGSVYISGDPLPRLARISGGRVLAHGASWEVVAGSKARNPDGTVNYVRLDVR